MLPRPRPTHAPPDAAAPNGPEGGETWVRPLESKVVPMTHVRGTLLVASREQLRAVGEFDRYDAALADTAKAQLTSLIAASWVPVDLASAHFAAIDRLELPVQVVEKATGAVAAKLQGTVLR